MIKNILNIVCLYLDINEYYAIKDDLKLSVSYYCKNVKLITQENNMIWASLNGYIELLKYFHSVGEDCTTEAMDVSCLKGHLKIVQYLHSIKKDCTTKAMYYASFNGHLRLVKYLHKIGKDCSLLYI